ncbi:hypothetical protein [Lusitaniella coriacea]|nr:hypothetical protein [Lusitaniella coriacea]
MELLSGFYINIHMSYSEFSFEDLKNKLNLNLREVEAIIERIEPRKPSLLIQETLKENLPIALGIDTEKARSEMILAPVLIELRKQCNRQVSLFSSIDLNIDKSKGLNRVCDFIISHSSEQLFLNSPVFTVVEAKNDNIKSGIPQCISEMVAAQIFNRKKNNSIPCIYGTVTTGSIWKFIKLQNDDVEIEMREHFIENLESLLGILVEIVRVTNPIIQTL